MTSETPFPDDKTVCFCHCVSAGEIRAAIRAGATSLHQIQAETCASTGCGGCEYDVLDLLQEEEDRARKEAGPSDTDLK